ncbi:MAG: hypothetical protein OEN02_12965, partial [Gammaproteobacteria bacterium]|nr:hypothetical protein [Gammaproteobacteria bacterium]
MNIVGRVITLLFISIATGCAISHPQSASEFRQGVPGAFLAKVEKYEVSQPFEQVASRFEKMAPRCLDKTIRTTSQTTTSYQVIVTDYNPTVIVHKDRAELHIQQDHLQGVMNVSEVPAGGYYLM